METSDTVCAEETGDLNNKVWSCLLSHGQHTFKVYFVFSNFIKFEYHWRKGAFGGGEVLNSQDIYICIHIYDAASGVFGVRFCRTACAFS